MACIICGKERVKKKQAGFLECRSCGLFYAESMPSKADLISKYVSGQISPLKYYGATKEEDAKTFGNRLKLLTKFNNGKNLLDVGCNIGTLLEVAKGLGFDARGTDINFMCREYGKTKGLKIDNVIEDELPYTRPFNLIIMNDVIEHMLDPVTYLKMLAAHLAPKGIIFIATPDVGSWKRPLFGKRWIGFKPGEHLYLFNKKTMARLAKRAGLEIIYMRDVPRVRSLKTITNKLKEVSGMDLSWLPFQTLTFNLDLSGELGVVLKKC